jgi:hypothetical protein
MRRVSERKLSTSNKQAPAEHVTDVITFFFAEKFSLFESEPRLAITLFRVQRRTQCHHAAR